MKKIALLLCLAIFVFGCQNDDESAGGAPNISGDWSLILITGGVVGADNSYGEGLIQWNFTNGTLTVANGDTSEVSFTLPSGTYEYFLQEDQGVYYLFIDGDDKGKMEYNYSLIAVDGSKQFDGRCDDCFNFQLKR